MKITIDTNEKTLTDHEKSTVLELYSKEAFEVISKAWLKVGWNEKHIYTFSWFGRPIIQLPEDMIRTQEVIYEIKPTVIIETGVAHGGSLIYYASLLKALGKSHSRVIGIDIEIRPHNRKAIEEHELFSYITLVEGSSTAPDIVNQVKSLLQPEDVVMVLLDSNHTKNHVAEELEAYCDVVTRGSYIIATDGIMQDVYDVPRGKAEWVSDHPSAAAIEFAQHHSEFKLVQPKWLFNESELDQNITHWPSAWLQRQ